MLGDEGGKQLGVTCRTLYRSVCRVFDINIENGRASENNNDAKVKAGVQA